MAARMCSKASTPTRASTANARSRPWPAKRRPWATPSWPWAPPRSRTSTLSQHRPPELAQHETGVPGPVGERGKCLHTPAQCPPEDPILHATPPAHPATPSTRTGLVPWERAVSHGHGALRRYCAPRHYAARAVGPHVLLGALVLVA